MSVRAVAAEATELFVGDESAPLQVVRITTTTRAAARLHVEGLDLHTPEPGDIAAYGQFGVEVAVDTRGAAPGTVLPARAVVASGADRIEADFDLVVAEPGWTMHMVSHFHYDPVWWNTQAAYTSEWDRLDFPHSPRGARQLAGFDLVRAHLAIARAEPEYRFVLAEVDYLKPYWDTFPADRELLRRLIAEGRVEIMGGAYNEPNTNLTDPETTVRNFVHGMGFQHHVLGADPHTAWQLDVFGHDPAFPGFAADAGLSSSSWARGPFHQWGPMEVTASGKGDPKRMQFDSEFEWISPSGKGILTAYMVDHYGSGWVMDSAPTLEAAEEATYRVFLGLKQVATTRHVLLPVGGDYTPPNKWVTEMHRDWNSRYVWPRFICSLPKDFFAGVRAELAAREERPTPQTRDMNPIYTGKDVSYIDTKQAQRATEFATLEAEFFAVFANLLAGAAYPDAALAKAWVQLAYGAHHDGITGSESDQVYLDLLTGWRDAHDLAVGVRSAALETLSSIVDTSGRGGVPVVVWNPLSHDRTDVVTVQLATPIGSGVTVSDDAGADLPALVEHGGHSVTFLAADVPSLGWRTFWLSEANRADQGWVHSAKVEAANELYRVQLEPRRGGAVTSLIELSTGRELITDGKLGNELAVYEEYPQHPVFGEGPWHLLPKGPANTSARTAADVEHARSPVGERLIARGHVGPVRYTQTITLWHGVSRVDCVTTVDEFTGADQLLRVRWPCHVPGAVPVSEVGNAVIGRGFGLIDVNSAHHPWTLDNPAHTWFGLSATGALRFPDGALRPIGVAEIVVPDRGSAAPLARELAVALARSGVTATVSTAEGARYGNLGVDSNLPDVRISLGGPEDNAFTAGLPDVGAGVTWVPPDKPLAEVWQPSADLRDPRALGVLVVPLDAVQSIVDSLAAHVIHVESGDLGHESYAERTVALLNRGLPGFAVDTAGTLHASLLRSCTGWPSGVWIDPPRRTTPDGANFQLQHWTHEFHYAITSGNGDWRTAGISATSAEFSRPLHPVVAEDSVHSIASRVRKHRYQSSVETKAGLAPQGTLLRVEPAGQVRLAALKAGGNPLTEGSGTPADPRTAVALRLVAHHGEPVTAAVHSPLVELTGARLADLLERPGAPLPDLAGPHPGLAAPHPGLAAPLPSLAGPLPDLAGPHPSLAVPVPGCDAVTVLATPTPAGPTADTQLGPEAEPAQPLYAKYWLHNRGPAPLGGLPVAVHLGADATTLTVASDRTDGDVHGIVRLSAPDGWAVEPAEVPFGLPPGAHLSAELTVTRPNGDLAPGAYPIRATAELAGDELPASWRQRVEDIALVTVPGADAPLLRFTTDPIAIRLAPGETGRVSVRVASAAHGPVNVEAWLVSPWGTWELGGPRAIGSDIPARGEVELGFDLAPPPWTAPGRWWALIKVAGAGTLLYSPAVALEVTR